MSGSVRQMMTCHWTARRIQRYLDADPSAPLTPGEVARLEEHLATCEKCTRIVAENRALHRVLSWWPGRRPVDPNAVTRMRAFLASITDDERH